MYVSFGAAEVHTAGAGINCDHAAMALDINELEVADHKCIFSLTARQSIVPQQGVTDRYGGVNMYFSLTGHRDIRPDDLGCHMRDSCQGLAAF
jgi:hypothetical protein